MAKSDKRTDFLKRRNKLGQKRKPFRLGRDQRSILCDAVERAINRESNEARIYWSEDLRRISIVDLRHGDRTKIHG